MKIGFFGDSFVSNSGSPCPDEYQTFIRMLSQHYNADLVHTGIGGSSTGDALINQFMQFVENGKNLSASERLYVDDLGPGNSLPDVCIFSWTDPGRLFHKQIRNINYSQALNYKNISNLTSKEEKIWIAAKEYFENLQDGNFDMILNCALLEYIDTHIFSKYHNKTKIIHMWSFPYNRGIDWFNMEKYFEKEMTYPIRWKHGVEIRPALALVSAKNCPLKLKAGAFQDNRPNHIEGVKKNTMIFNWLKDAIDNYDTIKYYDRYEELKLL